jgi:meso-butanediol dehydrogenase/(S,S)-butanediol dehydrogenase/diacetyl reductase
MRLKDKVAIITGAGSGIGQATAILFGKEGASVVVVDFDKLKGEETADLIKAQCGNAIFLQTDVSKADDVKKMIHDTIHIYSKLDILVNNVGILLQSNIVDTSENDWDQIMDINLKSAFLCCKFAIPEMIKSGKGGVIVNISSEAGLIGIKNLAAYSISKSGLISLTKTVAVDFAAYNIRANCVCPGTTETTMVKDAIRRAEDPEKLYREYAKRPANRLGKPEEIAAGILYLASDESPYATGAILSIDGGSTS